MVGIERGQNYDQQEKVAKSSALAENDHEVRVR